MSEPPVHEKLLDRVRKLVALACDDRGAGARTGSSDEHGAGTHDEARHR